MLDELVRLSQRAGDAAMSYYQTNAQVYQKADSSPVTAADIAAQEVIVPELQRWDSSVPIVAEEAPFPTGVNTADEFWLVDPLDGTKEFIGGNGEFTVNIALIAHGEPVLGVVHAPALGLTYYAGKALYSWRRRRLGSAERICSAPPTKDEALIVVESRSHPSAELEAYLARITVARRIRIGSSLKLCLVAEGSAHIYPRFGPTMEWDVAAGDCVFRNSGISVPRVSPLRYGLPGFRNGPFVLGLDDDAVA